MFIFFLRTNLGMQNSENCPRSLLFLCQHLLHEELTQKNYLIGLGLCQLSLLPKNPNFSSLNITLFHDSLKQGDSFESTVQDKTYEGKDSDFF